MHVQVLAFFLEKIKKQFKQTHTTPTHHTTKLADKYLYSVIFICFNQPLACLKKPIFVLCPANIKGLFWSKHTRKQ